MAALARFALVAALLAAGRPGAGAPDAPDAYADWDGRRIVEEVSRRHEQFPYVYEEQTMVLMDRAGNRNVRRLRRFSRLDADGRFRFLLVFDDPQEIRGVALLAVRHPDARVERGVYLPAFGPELKRPADDGHGGNFLGTDFAIQDLTAEVTDDHRYVRGADRRIDEVDYFVVDAYPGDADVERRSGYGMRRHLVRKDNFVIARTDFFDRRLRQLKRLSRHDLKRVSGDSWRANMIVVSDDATGHRTLLKVDRRVYSGDYVPTEIFEPRFLLSGGHLHGLDERVAGRRPPAAMASGARSTP